MSKNSTINIKSAPHQRVLTQISTKVRSSSLNNKKPNTTVVTMAASFWRVFLLTPSG